MEAVAMRQPVAMEQARKSVKIGRRAMFLGGRHLLLRLLLPAAFLLSWSAASAAFPQSTSVVPGPVAVVDAVLAVVDALHEATRKLHENPQDVYEVFAKETGYSLDAVKFMIEKKLSTHFDPKDTAPSAQNMTEIFKILERYNVVKEDKPIEPVLKALVHQEFVEKVLAKENGK
jgi:hypothetical protein